MELSFNNYKNFYLFTIFTRKGLLNKHKNNALSFYFLGNRSNNSLLNFNLFFYNYIYIRLFLKHLLGTKTGKIIIFCIDGDDFFLINSLLLKYNLKQISVYLWTSGLITNPTVTFKSNTVLYSSLAKKKKRTVQTEKLIKLIITAGYSKNLITEAKKRNLPILGLTDTENPFFLDYLIAGDAGLSSSIYLNFNLLFYFLNEFYRK